MVVDGGALGMRGEGLRQLAAVGDHDVRGGLAALRALALDGLDDVHAIDDTAEDDVLAVQPLRLHGADEELRAVRVGTRVRHAQTSKARVFACLARERLVFEFLAVDGLASSPVSAREVPALAHET